MGRDGVDSVIIGDDVQRPDARQKKREILEVLETDHEAVVHDGEAKEILATETEEKRKGSPALQMMYKHTTKHLSSVKKCKFRQESNKKDGKENY